MKNDLHNLFEHRTDACYHNNIKLAKQKKDKLQDAASELSSAIKAAFASQPKALLEVLSFKTPTPLFAAQGSFTYGTIIEPANNGQQIDLDLGVYLPFSALNDGSASRKVIEVYFDIIESCIDNHIKTNGKSWSLLEGKNRKDTCARVELDSGSHIDFPLYGYPEQLASSIGQSVNSYDKKALLEGAAMFEDAYALDRLFGEGQPLKPTQIHFADRKKGWQPSNAIVLGKYIKNRLKQHGSESRAICRYIKGWRDVKWSNGGGPSSIYLLALCIESLDSTINRHCDLLQQVANKSRQIVDTQLLIPCPIEGNPENYEDLNKRLTDDQKKEYRRAFEDLANKIDASKTQNDPKLANNELIRLFGDRMPYIPERVKLSNNSTNSIKKTVLSAPAIKRPNHTPRNSIAG